MEICIDKIKNWMHLNLLKLNDNKTEALLVGTRTNLTQVKETQIRVGQSTIEFSDRVKNLGVIFDRELSMEANVSQTIRSCHFQLRNIGAIRHLLPTSAAHALVRSLVLSRLDFCNSLLVNISSEQLQRLQRVENTAARIVMKCKKSSHITPTLIQLHWLPVQARVEYKVLSLAYQCYHQLAPTSIGKPRATRAWRLGPQ